LITLMLVDPLTTTTRTFSVPELPTQFTDLRLKDGLDPNNYYTQQKQVTIVTPGQPFVLQDISGSRFEAYDSLPKVFSLFRTVSRETKLDEFSFLMTWPKLKDPEKRELYSKHACHELSFFIFHKDKPFFDTVVKPYLTNKKDKTFLDHWLLGNDLGKFTDPWNHAKLNMAERVLLAQRLANEPAKTARHLSDLLKLLPPNIGRELYLFDTAISNEAMSLGDNFGLGKAQAEEKRRKSGVAKDATFDAPMSAAPQGGGRPGFGGGMGGPGMPGGMPAARGCSSTAERTSPTGSRQARRTARRVQERDEGDGRVRKVSRT
jgi:hypothetical protein